MKTRSALIASVYLYCVLLGSPSEASAQDERRFINPTDIPLASARVEDFVPRGWVIEERVNADVNRDGQVDTILGLIEDLPDEVDGMINARYRALIVLTRTANNSLRRAAVAPRLLRCTMCGGMFSRRASTDEISNGVIEVENGVIVIYEMYGSNEATEYTVRFRHDRLLDRFVLIGADVFNVNRATNVSRNESTNYLTGVRIVRAYRSDSTLASSTRRRVRVETRLIEQIDYENY